MTDQKFKTGCAQNRLAARDESLRRLVSSLKNGGDPMSISEIAKRARTSSEYAREYFEKHGASHKIQDSAERHYCSTEKRRRR